MPKTALLEEKSSTSTSYWVLRALPAISHAKTTNNSTRGSGKTIGLYSGRDDYDQPENKHVAQQYTLEEHTSKPKSLQQDACPCYKATIMLWQNPRSGPR